jgi:subtilisin family serine protease
MYNCGATPSEPSPDHICKFSDGTGTCELIPTPSYIKDPDFKYQYWYLGPNGANVVAAWDLGFTGQGVHIRVNDDGLDYMNPEFSPKHLPGWKDPMPENCTTDTHGTSCAGIAAASSNNECGVGVAFNAYVSAANIFI